MRILMVASEALPYAKTGGLADVLGALPRALVRLGHTCDVVLPRYRGTGGTLQGAVQVQLGGHAIEAGIYTTLDDGVRTILLDHPPFFDRDHLYGEPGRDYADNPLRFACLAQGALDWAVTRGGARYDVVHAHDWQTGLTPVLLGGMFRSGRWPGRVPTVFTIHNLSYQGVFDASWLPVLGLGWDLMRTDAMEFWGRISFLKAGIVFSRLVTTVSPRYAQEMQRPEGGFGFEGILRARAGDLVGILNGIDYDQWDPMRDPHLPEPFDAARLDAKLASKRAVLTAFGMPVGAESERRPLVAMISRLVDQKGFDLLVALADELPRLPATFVLLGAGEAHHEAFWEGLAARYPDRIGVRIGFDEGLAHLIEAGADLFLMPSRFEPCGLNQLYSLRYGTLPLVCATGGLADSVRNLDPRTGEGTGFTFDERSPAALLGTLRWALATWEDRGLWRRMQRAGMAEDHSWDASARQYVRVYERASVGVWA